jgi:hypothetical protein
MIESATSAASTPAATGGANRCSSTVENAGTAGASCAMAKAASSTAATAPPTPAQVLPGLIAGASFRRPHWRPAK